MEWAEMVLDGLRAPVTEANLKVMELWAASEGTPAKWNNWLATTMNGHGGRQVNEVGVKAYPSVEDGVKATVATLRLSYYDLVVKHLQTGASLLDIFSAINQSPWCAGCQGGHYPISLWKWVNSTMVDLSHVPGPPEYDVKVTDAAARKDGGVYVLGADGGVFTFHGAPFFGSYPGIASTQKGQRGIFDRIVLDADEAGYTIYDEGDPGGYHFTGISWAEHLSKQ